MKLKKIVPLATLTLATALAFAACTNNSKKSAVETITIATSASSNPFEFTKDGSYTGFEVELMKKIDADLSNYTFKFSQVKDDSILLSLDAGRAQMAMNNFGKTPARAEKYLYTYPEFKGENAIFSRKSAPITTVAGLFGKHTEIPTGTNYGAIMEAWNTKNPKQQITISYSGNALSDRLYEISTGKIDFLFADKAAASNYVTQRGLSDKVVANDPSDLANYPEFQTYSYFILPKSETKLQTALNAELKKFQADGTLKQLSEEWFKADRTPAASEYK
ncbi:MAG: transporter substrate-binding domain-containing protein [Streptococcaceae bacterium]|jgi:polar amino acid transport system substrate-binding protein|nr:transporter substrate-binding domain-containing protein [Streptococcaceae bacterium]